VPAAARYRMAGQPRPPAPTTSTEACRRRTCPAVKTALPTCRASLQRPICCSCTCYAIVQRDLYFSATIKVLWEARWFLPTLHSQRRQDQLPAVSLDVTMRQRMPTALPLEDICCCIVQMLVVLGRRGACCSLDFDACTPSTYICRLTMHQNDLSLPCMLLHSRSAQLRSLHYCLTCMQWRCTPALLSSDARRCFNS
jgi:hypothetical protein